MSNCATIEHHDGSFLPPTLGKRAYKYFNFKERSKYDIIVKRRRLFSNHRKTIGKYEKKKYDTDIICAETLCQNITVKLNAPKLDPCNPIHAHKMKQRKRMIEKGKNTVGYDQYVKRVLKSQRKPRSLCYPTTPDHTDDIPNKRWLGLVRVWRKSLHQFDPPEMLQKTAKSLNAVNDDQFCSFAPSLKSESSDLSNKSFLFELSSIDKSYTDTLSNTISKTSLKNCSLNETDFIETTPVTADDDAVRKFNLWKSFCLNSKNYLEEFPIDYDEDSDYELL